MTTVIKQSTKYVQAPTGATTTTKKPKSNHIKDNYGGCF